MSRVPLGGRSVHLIVADRLCAARSRRATNAPRSGARRSMSKEHDRMLRHATSGTGSYWGAFTITVSPFGETAISPPAVERTFSATSPSNTIAGSITGLARSAQSCLGALDPLIREPPRW